MSVPPVSSSLQVPVDKSVSVHAPCALTSDTTVSASSSGPVLPASYFVRDSEQITTSKALLVLQEGPRASESSLLAETIAETTHPSDSGCHSAFRRLTWIWGHYTTYSRRTMTADSRPYPRLVDPAAVTLPLQSTPIDEARITWYPVCIASIWKATTSSRTNTPYTGRNAGYRNFQNPPTIVGDRQRRSPTPAQRRRGCL